MDDMDLLREYALRRSEAAFETLVSRYSGLVYSAALRQVQDPSIAEEITHVVFILLGQKAGKIKTGTVLAGWLYSATWFTAMKALRNEKLRRDREQAAAQEAAAQNAGHETKWNDIAPVLDAAMMRLAEKDRDAILLRFFKQKPFKEVAAALGTTEEGARKRVERALEVLRKALAGRDIAVPSVLLVGLLSTKTVSAVPLASAAVTSAVMQGTTAGTSTLALVKGTLKAMAWTKTKTMIASGAAALFVAGTAIVTNTQHNELERTRKLYLDEMRRADAALSEWNAQGPKGLLQRKPATNAIDWRSVDSPDYRQYIANMKAIGVPWETIKDIIFADVNKLYAQKAQATGAQQSRKFWEADRVQSVQAEKDRIEKLNQLEEERKAVIRALVGIESDEEIRRRLAWSPPSGPQLDFLPDQKRAQVQALDKYDILRDALQKRIGSAWSKEDVAELNRIDAEKRAALAQILTPEELENYDLVTHPVAAQMRADLGSFNPSEEEFRKMFANRRKLSDRTVALQTEARLNPAATGFGLQMAEAEKEADRDLETQLGPQRYADYVRTRDPEFQALSRVGEDVGLSEETVKRAYEIKKEIGARYAALEENVRRDQQKIATSAELQANLKANLAAIEQAEESALRQALGDKGFEYFKSFNVAQQPPVASPK